MHAELPDAELVRYATFLRSITAGTGRFRREFNRYELVPPNVAAALRAPAEANAPDQRLRVPNIPRVISRPSTVRRGAGEGLERRRLEHRFDDGVLLLRRRSTWVSGRRCGRLSVAGADSSAADGAAGAGSGASRAASRS